MKNLLTTPARDVILVDAGGRRQLLESPKVPLPEVARLGQTNTPTGTAQRAVPTVRLTEIGSTRTAEWNIALADQRTQDPPPTADEILERIHKRIENAFRDTDPSTERSAILLLDSTEFEWNRDEFDNFLARVARESPETQVIAYRPPR